MKLHTLVEPAPPALAAALEDFERQFTYPLGPGRSFRIEHAVDYGRFYRCIGEGRCVVAEREGNVLGVISAALRPLLEPDGQERTACYLGDLKTAPEARGGRLLLHFLDALGSWARPRATVAFGVVMDGTRAVPTNYSGRVGIPGFAPVGKTVIFRFSCNSAANDGRVRDTSEAEVRECFRRLSIGRYATAVGDPAERSSMAPVWITAEDGAACGCLEDTRRAKRLISDDGVEMISAHLSSFAYQSSMAGAALVRSALGRAADLGYPALFVAVAEPDAAALHDALGQCDAVIAPATIYAHGMNAGALWNINTSEI